MNFFTFAFSCSSGVQGGALALDTFPVLKLLVCGFTIVEFIVEDVVGRGVGRVRRFISFVNALFLMFVCSGFLLVSSRSLV